MIAVKLFIGFYGMAIVSAIIAWLTNGERKQ
jgi:hypothetical protein